MFKKLYVTPFDQEQLDPNGILRQKLHQMDVERFNPPSKYFSRLDIQEWKHRLSAIQNHFSNEAYREYNESMFSKMGLQGGSFGLRKLVESYTPFYTNAEYRPEFDVVKIGRDYLIRLCQQLVEKYGLPQPYKSTWVSTHAGVPTGLKKGSYVAETVDLPLKFKHLLADFPGMRRQRQKDRTINQDSVTNVRWIEDILNGIRLWAKTYIPYFASWCNPALGVQNRIWAYLQRPFTSVSFDFKHMDEHFSKEVALEIVLPIWNELCTPAEQLHLGSYVEQAFEQPIYFGSFMLTGKHNLLSGQSITNDIETWYSVCLLIGSILVNNGELDKWLVLANGDDTLLITNKQQTLISEVMDSYHQEANLNGVVVEPSKTLMSTDRVIYLRRLYQQGGVVAYNSDGHPYYVGAYPSALALNNIITPERLSPSPGYALCATCQRLDNVYGSPDYHELVQLVFKHARGLEMPTEEDVRSFAWQDWWNRVYEEPWKPESSRTFQLLMNSKALKLK